MKRLLLAVVTVLALSANSYAIPTLQLDILGGTYNTATQTIDAPGNIFKLYAYLIPDAGSVLLDDYYISAAVSPQVTAPASLGSFLFEGELINVTASGMNYGTPPFEELEPPDLPSHGVFPTYFREFDFNFSSGLKATAYNTGEAPFTQTGQGPTPNAAGTMYYMEFDIDVTNLDSDYVIHFDLYNSKLKQGKNGDIWKTQFAPFSHDASSIPSTQVPEPSSLILLGTGLLAFALRRRARN
jgi:hypothetical protein